MFPVNNKQFFLIKLLGGCEYRIENFAEPLYHSYVHKPTNGLLDIVLSLYNSKFLEIR
jgi:hypothetical protein